MSRKNKKTVEKIVQNSVREGDDLSNGLTDVVMGQFNNVNGSTQLSQTDSFFVNNKWYMLSNMRHVLSQMYVEHGLIQALIDVPVEDALRGGIEIHSKQLSQDDIDGLISTMEAEGIIETVGTAMKWTRLFGGGGLVFMTNQDHHMKLDVSQNALKGMELRAVDMWELFNTQQNIQDDTSKMDIKKQEFCYSYYAIQLHNSRVIPMKGLIAPSFIRPRLRGWGFSVVESLVQSLNQYFKAKNLTFEVLDEFKLDIFKIKGFNSLMMSKDGTAKAIQRVQLANHQKNYQNAMTMDSEDDHVSKQLNFAGISEIMKEIRMQIASDMRMPMSKLFGIASSGFGSGEDDIEVYNCMIESQVRSKMKKPITEVVKMYCAREFGIVPDDIRISFKPLRILSANDEEGVKTAKLNNVVTALEKGICSVKEAKDSINKDNLISVKVDSGDETLKKELDVAGDET